MRARRNTSSMCRKDATRPTRSAGSWRRASRTPSRAIFCAQIEVARGDGDRETVRSRCAMSVQRSRASPRRPVLPGRAASLDLTPANFTSAADVDAADLAAYGTSLARLLYHPPPAARRNFLGVRAESSGLLLYALPHDANEDDCEVRRVAARRNRPPPPAASSWRCRRSRGASLVVGLPEAATGRVSVSARCGERPTRVPRARRRRRGGRASWAVALAALAALQRRRIQRACVRRPALVVGVVAAAARALGTLHAAGLWYVGAIGGLVAMGRGRARRRRRCSRRRGAARGGRGVLALAAINLCALCPQGGHRQVEAAHGRGAAATGAGARAGCDDGGAAGGVLAGIWDASPR